MISEWVNKSIVNQNYQAPTQKKLLDSSMEQCALSWSPCRIFIVYLIQHPRVWKYFLKVTPQYYYIGQVFVEKVSAASKMTNKAAKDILGVDKESEFLQSFVRVGIRSDCEEEEKRISIMNSSPKKGDLHKQTSDGRSESSDGKAPRMSKYSRGIIP